VLASYELLPGSVIHGGYESLWERPDFDPYRVTTRAFFFKASYLARFHRPAGRAGQETAEVRACARIGGK
jgi:hypothetical protein